MQLSLSTLIIIVSLLASLVLTKSKEEFKKIKIPMNDRNDFLENDESTLLKASPNEFSARMIDNCPNFRTKRQVSKSRNGRTTYVKAILSNPKISASQQLAEKLALAELKSPKMQETFKKLTAVNSPRKISRRKGTHTKISSTVFVDKPKIFHDTYKPPRFKGPRRRKRKRHKNRQDDRRHKKSSRRINSSRVRLSRQIDDKSAKTVDKGEKERYEKSNDEKFVNYENEPNIQDPYANLNAGLNYPGVEDLETSLPNSEIDENNSLNYGTNYSPIGDEINNGDISNSMIDETQDFSLPNDQLPANEFIPSEVNSYQKNRYDEKLDDPNPREGPNSLRSRQYDFPRPNQLSIDRSIRKNSRIHLNVPRIEANRNFPLPNPSNRRNNYFRNNYVNTRPENFGKIVSSSNSNYRSVSIDSLKGHEKNRISKSQRNLDQLPESTNISANDLSTSSSSNNVTKLANVNRTLKNITLNDGESSRTRKALRIEKSEISMDKLMSGISETCTTTEMNPKLSGIGEAPAAPPETIDENLDEGKNLKGMGYHLLPMSSPLEPQASLEKSMLFGNNDSAIANETKVVAGQILNKIIEELEDLKLDRNTNDHKEGMPCKLSGSWITTQAGVRIDMLVTNRSVNVSIAKLNLPVGMPHQGLLNYTWNITGHAPFRRGGPLCLVATDNRTKSLAVFVGACRVCQGVDTIEGVWSIAREPRDCRDFQMATSIYNDIFRRTQLLSTSKEKQLAMINTIKFTNTLATPVTKGEYSTTSS